MFARRLACSYLLQNLTHTMLKITIHPYPILPHSPASGWLLHEQRCTLVDEEWPILVAPLLPTDYSINHNDSYVCEVGSERRVFSLTFGLHKLLVVKSSLLQRLDINEWWIEKQRTSFRSLKRMSAIFRRSFSLRMCVTSLNMTNGEE